MLLLVRGAILCKITDPNGSARIDPELSGATVGVGKTLGHSHTTTVDIDLTPAAATVVAEHVVAGPVGAVVRKRVTVSVRTLRQGIRRVVLGR